MSRSFQSVLNCSLLMPLCFIAFVSSRIAVLFVPVPDPLSDAGWYLSRAITLANDGTYSEGGILTAYWPVGYPAFLALLFKIAGPSLLAARVANLVLASASFWLLYFVVKRFMNDELVARGTVLLFTLYPNNAAYVSLLLTETLYTFLLLVASLLLLSRQNWTLVTAGVTFGLAILVKTQTMLLIPILAFLASIEQWSFGNAYRAMLRSGAVCLLALAVVVPWTIRNYAVFKTFVLVSTNGGMALLAGNNASVVGDYRSDFSPDDPLLVQAQFSVDDQIAANRRASSLALNWIKDNPGQFLRLIPKKLFRLWAVDGEGEWGYQDSQFYRANWVWFRAARVVNQVFYFAALSLCLVGFWMLAKTRISTPRTYYGLAVVAIITLISAVFSGQSRYHFPAMPFVLAYAAWVLLHGEKVSLNGISKAV